MQPLDLRAGPPRGPRVQLAGLVFTARLVDKLRAALPGGALNGYLPTTGFSRLWSHHTRIDLADLQRVVAAAPDEAGVETWIAERTAGLDKAALNGKMERFDSSRTPTELRAVFEELYPLELREAYPILFDLFEADDRRLYAGRL
jgi:hypothetical protein